MTAAKPRSRPTDPAPWIARFSAEVPSRGSVLDLACGGGRHGRLFLRNGRTVTFLDKDISATSDLIGNPQAERIEVDLETDAGWPLDERKFDAVIVANYLWRPILPNIVAAVAPGGLLLYETFALGNEAFGRPRNPDFLLRPGELLETVRGQLDILGYEQRTEGSPNPRVIQHIAARRPQ